MYPDNGYNPDNNRYYYNDRNRPYRPSNRFDYPPPPPRPSNARQWPPAPPQGYHGYDQQIAHEGPIGYVHRQFHLSYQPADRAPSALMEHHRNQLIREGNDILDRRARTHQAMVDKARHEIEQARLQGTAPDITRFAIANPLVRNVMVSIARLPRLFQTTH
jgi:hypothetical protein